MMIISPFKRSFSDQLPQPFLMQYDGSGRVACVCYTCLHGGGSLIRAGRGGLGGMGWLGGRGMSCHQNKHQGSFSQPRKSGVTFQDFHTQECRHTPSMYIHREGREQGIMLRESGLLQMLLPGPQGTRIFTLWSGCPRQDQQVLAQTRRILRTGGDRVRSSHGHDGPVYSLREPTKAHALQV